MLLSVEALQFVIHGTVRIVILFLGFIHSYFSGFAAAKHFVSVSLEYGFTFLHW